MSVRMQAVRYVLAGSVNTAAGLAVIMLAMLLGVSPVPANALGYAVGLSVSFVLNRRWTFRNSAPWHGQVAPFAAVMAVAYATNLATLKGLISTTTVAPLIAQVASAVVYGLVGFAGLRLLVFGDAPPAVRRRRARLLCILLAAAFWAGVWWQLNDSPLTRVQLIDEGYYQNRAAAIADGQWSPQGPFYMSPLYPYLLWATGSTRDLDPQGVLTGNPPLGIRVLQAGLWCGIVLMLLGAGRRLIGPRLSWIPPVLFILYRPPAALANTSLLEVPYLFCTLAVLYLVTEDPPGQKTRRTAILAGLLLGLAALLRGTALVLLVPVFAGWMRPTGSWRHAVAPFSLTAVFALLVMFPAALHNTRVTGQLSGPSMNAGIVLYAGNGPRATGYQVTGRDFHFDQDPSGRSWLMAATGRDVKGAAALDRAWREEAFAAMAADPARTTRLLAKKAWLQVMSGEIPNVTPLDAWGRQSSLLAVLALPYGALAALGLAGLVLTGWRPGPARPWALAFIVLVATQSLFFVVSRYRLVLTPLFALFAGLLVKDLLKRRGRSLVGPLILVGACVVAVQPWGQRDTLSRLKTAGLVNEARRWQALGNHEKSRGDSAEATTALIRSRELFARAVARSPQSDSFRSLARSQAALGEKEDAVQTLQKGLVAVPADERPPLRKDLALLYLKADQPDRALQQLAPYLRERPDDLAARHLQVVLLSRTGRLDEAIARARDTVARHPDNVQSHRDLGRALARAGRFAEARDALTEGVRLFPGDPEMVRLLKAANRELAKSGG